MTLNSIHRIFALAECIEPDRSEVWHWLQNTPIQALDGYTAQELIGANEGERVEAWLEATLLRELEWGDGNSARHSACLSFGHPSN